MKLIFRTALAVLAWLCLSNRQIAAAEPIFNPSAQGSTVSRTPFQVASEGKALTPIVVAPAASKSTRDVADDLAAFLQRVTGATFQVTEGDGTAGLVVGTLADFPDPQLSKPLEIRKQFDGREAFAIRTEAKRLRLIGATELGTAHATTRFLELIGCRRFFPGQAWEVIPTRPTLSFAVNEVNRPALLSRGIGFGGGFIRDVLAPDDIYRPMKECAAWKRWNFEGESFKVYAGHSWQGIVWKYQKEFDQHPEYYALIKQPDGTYKRQYAPGGKLEVTNPAVQQMAVDYALDYLRKHPEADMVSMEPSDGGGWSESPEAKALGSISNQAYFLANIVARAVAKEFPGKFVGMYAYGWHSDPPTFPVEPNIVVQRTAGYTYSKTEWYELLNQWTKKVPNVGVYEYYSVWVWDQDKIPGARGGDIKYLTDSIRRYYKAGVNNLWAEGSGNFGIHGRGYYLATRLMWNPNADVDEILNDFYEKAFGPAAGVMKRYYDRLDPGNFPVVTTNLMAQAFRDVDEASRLAAARPDVLARLDDQKQYLRFSYLQWLLDRTTDKEKRRALTLDLLTDAYRGRWSYMTHWELMRQLQTNRAAKEFDDPTWSFTWTKTNPPWRDRSPLLHDEIEAKFQEGLRYFEPVPVDDIDFNLQDVTPIEVSAPPAAPSYFYYGDQSFALWSHGGEPLKCTLETGLIYRDRADTTWTLTDKSGTKVASGQLPQDNQVHPLEIKVPAPGSYVMAISSPAAGWTLRATPETLLSFEPLKGRDFTALIPFHQYFYVPKGTNQIQMYSKGDSRYPFKVINPASQVAAEVSTSGGFTLVPVPPGMDGQFWELGNVRVSWLRFFNIPNVLASSPANYLMPRDVAVKDGWKIRS